MFAHTDFMKVPMSFLVAEDNLKVSIFIYSPVSRKVVPFLTVGMILTLDDLMSLMRLAPSQVLMPKSEA